jgi:Skp family chaperone for outer membrane proteins
MTKMFKAAALALATIPVVTLAAPAYAQSGVAVANLEGAIEQTNAYRTAMTQMQTTYKAQIDQARTRSTALDAELKPLVDAFNAAQRQPNPNRQALQTQYNTLQQRRQTADQEIQRITAPVTLARAYVLEQFTNGGRLDAAVKAAMAAKRVNLVVQPQAVLLAQPAADLTTDITNELNKTVTSVQITPPAGWQPGQQQAAAGAAPAAAPAPATATPPGR